MLVKMMLIPKAEFNHAVHGLKCSLLTKTVSAFGMPVRLVAIAYKDRSEYFKEKE